ncbi:MULTISPECIES: hypothetical protein [Marinobacter]|jgi:hypothetical protein|uniref:Methyl-accepting chemotaxis protein n=2 Tax=Marinobacter TaxID=2742 RepID=A0A137SBJ8_9GAMM|nr:MULTISPECIES: hypothetical protein [Marinobacter]KXO09807.1 hypothetical protein J122_2085 [Marinobacter excellens LAMA 842]OJT00278.1 hypothetical protein BEE62_09415 [Marinobacter nauticus]PSF11555.1 hypothetical protein C7H10_17680 [Marinobacter shengliensis]QFS87271.1 hypothetical protein FIV08_10550 [Marinobacter sp. THAF197a]QFT51055.1 hypothetical protein FIU96_10470 [Marinobacter sp. THAF39]
MKDARLRIQSLLAALLLLSLTAFGAQAQDTGADFLSDLHDFRINNYLALDSFYAFSANGDTEALNRIVGSINASNNAMNAVIASTSGVLSPQQVEGLNQDFDQFKDLMRGNINEVRDRGYPDLRLMADLANKASSMNERATELYGVAQENSGTQADARIESARSAAVVMAQMMARYSARTHSSVAQTFQGASDEASLDQQALMFDSLLARVQSGSASAELKAAIDDVSSKWQFIRSSYINYNENNVSFVIDRYSKGIIRSLTTTIEILESNA